MPKIIILSIVIALFMSALYFFIARFVLHYLLVKRGIKVIFGLSGLPGYLECLYFKTDNRSVRSSNIDRLIFSLAVSFIIVLICSLSLFLIIHYQH